MEAPSSQNKSMEKPTTQDPHPQQPLKCPRCDSSNTKFCYYNNYSLSQPRHFCKACKRYWTRGGTLRNVPVGGGCRKNKRVKRPSSSSGGDAHASSSAAVNPSRMDLSPNHISNPNLFYSLQPTNPLELNFPFSSFRVSSDHNNGFNDLGIGFSSGLIQESVTAPTTSSSFPVSGNYNHHNNNSSFFGSSSTMASLLASTFQHQKFNNVPGLMRYENGKEEVKLEGGNRFAWNPNPDPNPNPNPNEHMISDPSSFLWNTSNVSSWIDPSNSSVPSLI